MERIALAREYRVAEWLRDAYFELSQKAPLDLMKLRPAKPHSNPLVDREADAKMWEATYRDWETLARIFCVQSKVAAFTKSISGNNYSCYNCDMDFGGSNADARLCKCRILRLVDEIFQGELESLREKPEHGEHPPPRKLPIFIFQAVSVERNCV